jgi:hypothetical protein
VATPTVEEGIGLRLVALAQPTAQAVGPQSVSDRMAKQVAERLAGQRPATAAPSTQVARAPELQPLR